MLDKAKTYATIDPEDIRYGVEHLSEQVRTAWAETKQMKLPAGFAHVPSIVIAGMGGSALGPEMLMTAFGDRLRVPVTIVRDYSLPPTVDAKSLVILSSFSGTTEETLSVADEVKKKKMKAIVIAAGGPLAARAKEEGWPSYVFSPGELAKEPRLGTCFSLIGIAGMLTSCGLLKLADVDVRRMLTAMGDVLDTSAIDVPESENPAKVVARALVGRAVCVVAAEHLVGNAHVMTNQINESGKQFAFQLTLPELNHHFLESTMYPKGFGAKMTVLMLRSQHYHPRVQKRFDITAAMFERVGVEVIDYEATGKDALEECGEVLQFGSFATYYLAIINGVNPRTTLYVGEFKKLMNQ